MAPPVRATRRSLAALLLVAALFAPACGRKTPVRPAEFVAPAAVGDLRARNIDAGVRLSWRRPRESADGALLWDLDAFVVERALPALPFGFVTRIQVPDRDKLRQQKRFTFVDEAVVMGEAYRYRVLAVTVDGFFSAPSNLVDIVRQAPLATPTAGPSPQP
jgi:hypothetical protein